MLQCEGSHAPGVLSPLRLLRVRVTVRGYGPQGTAAARAVRHELSRLRPEGRRASACPAPEVQMHLPVDCMCFRGLRDPPWFPGGFAWLI